MKTDYVNGNMSFQNENRLCQWKFKIKTDYVNGKLKAVAG
jgi:hypothetical protein